MSTATTLFRLVGDSSGMFDGSVIGVPILKSTGAKVLPRDSGIALEKGAIDIGRQSDLDSLQSFTIEAEIAPSSLGGTRQNIIEGQTPSIALFVEANRKLVGSVHTASGWITVDSGAVLLRAGASQRVTFTRDISGKSEVFIDGTSVGSVTVAGPIQNIGPLGFRVGRGMDGTSFPFSGTVKDLSIRQGVVTQQFFAQQAQTAQRLQAKVRQAGVIKNIVVNLLPDASHARLQHVNDIMNAAGVQTRRQVMAALFPQITVSAMMYKVSTFGSTTNCCSVRSSVPAMTTALSIGMVVSASVCICALDVAGQSIGLRDEMLRSNPGSIETTLLLTTLSVSLVWSGSEGIRTEASEGIGRPTPPGSTTSGGVGRTGGDASSSVGRLCRNAVLFWLVRCAARRLLRATASPTRSCFAMSTQFTCTMFFFLGATST
jgi:hypothetical protein